MRASVPTENSMQPRWMSFLQPTAKVNQSVALLETGGRIRRLTRLQRSIVQTQRPMAGEKVRGVVKSGFSGSPSLVTAVQSTDLRHCHDGPHLRRPNRSWLR